MNPVVPEAQGQAPAAYAYVPVAVDRVVSGGHIQNAARDLCQRLRLDSLFSRIYGQPASGYPYIALVSIAVIACLHPVSPGRDGDRPAFDFHRILSFDSVIYRLYLQYSGAYRHVILAADPFLVVSDHP